MERSIDMVKVYINGELITGNETPFVLVWNNDAERIAFIEMISHMEKREGPRGIAIFPDGTPEPQIQSLIKNAIESCTTDKTE